MLSEARARGVQPAGVAAWKEYMELGYQTEFGSAYCFVLERDNLEKVMAYNCHSFAGASSVVDGSVKLSNAWHSVVFRASKTENTSRFYVDNVPQSALTWSCVSNLNIVTIGGAYALDRYITAVKTQALIMGANAPTKVEVSDEGKGKNPAMMTDEERQQRIRELFTQVEDRIIDTEVILEDGTTIYDHPPEV